MENSSLLFLVVALLLVQLLPATNAIGNITADQSALIALKDHIIHDPRNLLTTNWSTSVSECHWIGVTCGARHLRVTGLNLSYMGLTGAIPPQLGNMSFLAMLNLKNNSFHSSLPTELARLWRLNDVNFGYNELSGEIPSWIGSLPRLQYLNLYGNMFSGSIPGSIFNISSLQVLDLSENQISGVIPSMINAASLQYLILNRNQLSGSLTSGNLNGSSLRYIDLGNNGLTGIIPEDLFTLLPELEGLYLPSNKFQGKLPSSLFFCKQLQLLYLPLNNFTGSIPREIGNLTLLNQFSLDNNNFQGGIPHEIGDLKNLELLSMQHNSLRGTMPPSLFNITSLTSIYLRENDLVGSLPEKFCQHLPFLEELYLSYNQFSGLLPSTLWQCGELRVLDLASNKFSGSIPRTVGNLTHLTEFYLYENSLTGTIPDEIGDLHELDVLGLSINHFIGLIPYRVFNISTLRKIGLAHNQLSGTLPLNFGLGVSNLEEFYVGENRLTGAIPNTISNMSKLTMLDMPANSFYGFIPNSIGTLSNLQLLNLMFNNLTMESPPQEESSLLSILINLIDLRDLRLSGNPLNLVLPTFLKNTSTSLQSFELGDCKIQGNIPKDISNLNSLMLLNLSYNGLSGSIPVAVGKLQMLQGLYLNDNNLQGSIPDEICQLEKISDLWLSNNKLFGSLPVCLGNLSAMRSLLLDFNELTSTIPSTTWSLRYILHMNLSSNSFVGSLPPNIGNLKVVMDIDFSSNQLSGSIPSTLGGLQNLVALSLANNTLEGSIPASFGKLVSLEFLDLSNNSISGLIPKSLEALLHLRYLNLSFNRLEGEIPRSGPFRKFTAQSFIWNRDLCGAPQLQAPPCRAGGHQRSRKNIASVLKIALPVVVSLTALFVALGIFLIKHSRRSNVKLTEEASSMLLGEWRRVSYDELVQASNGFHENSLLGCGSFGSVYKGTLSDGTSVAIKVFNLQIEAALKSFIVESEVLSSVRHRNLIRIISYCSRLNFKALVLDYMPQGSLERWLHSHNLYLSILQRLNITVEIASALEYLHCGNSVPIIHCDLKPSNVLLDSDMVAHVADFGISKLLGGEESMCQTITLATVGYMAPEYGSEGIVSVAGDVYSFGILVLEMFTRKKPTDEMFHSEMSLKQWVAANGVMEVADASILRAEEEQYSAMKDCLASILGLALACSADLPKERMNTEGILTGLNKIRKKFLKDTGRT